MKAVAQVNIYYIYYIYDKMCVQLYSHLHLKISVALSENIQVICASTMQGSMQPLQ